MLKSLGGGPRDLEVRLIEAFARSAHSWWCT